MMNLYCDESHDGRTYALAGWLAVPGGQGDYGWDGFSSGWREMLATIKRPDGSDCPAIHTVDIVQRRRVKDSPYKGWKQHQAKEAFDKASDVILNTNKCGNMWAVGCSIAIPRDAATMATIRAKQRAGASFMQAMKDAGTTEY
jgi:hypothetical protein